MTTSAWERPWCASLDLARVGERVEVVGWVRRRRDLGGLVFVDLRDRSGLLQLVFEEAMVAEGERLSAEDVVRVSGTVRERAEGQANPKLASGAIEVKVEELNVLTAAETPPFVVEDRVNATANLVLRHQVVAATRRYFDDMDFVEVETPILTRSTPEGARDFLVPSRIHKSSFYALPQSPQLFKQLLQVAGLGRYLFARIFPLVGIEPPATFPRLSYDEAMERFGSDRPDTRFGLELEELGPLCEGCGFRVLEEAAADGRVKGLVFPGGASLSRKQLDGLSEFVKPYGAAGVLWFKRIADGVASPAKKALGDDGVLRFLDAAGAEEGDVLLVVGGPESTVFAALGALRTHLAREHGLIPEDRHDFLWVTDFPLLEWDSGEERFHAMHHPFTAPTEDDTKLLESDPGAARARAYDVVMDGVELGGGSIRIHNPEVQRRMFAALGINKAEAEARFGFLLEAFRYGVPPHGGIALGLDRMLMLMAGRDSIRDVIAFPKTTSATCLMTRAPSEVDAHQMEELGLTTRS